ncbi:MFS transporter [Nocardia goodfellowii]|uniref:MFS family permease n=1 Tax=Nocardia goodfellowii TaxID=882446 RepID=A0ABS4Q7P4_9NOCA|nr:MFS transporter [Nocardia goodfellowii]MBP2187160.1 MFS family permease [Nocardia goodfellowii]
MLDSMVERPMRRARVAVFTVFALNGFLLALWVVHIPVITDRTGVAKSTLGTFILMLAGAGIIGMRIAGPLADRFGSRTLVGAAAAITAVTVIGPGLATGPVPLALALACFGFGNGALDVSMNTQAVHVERAYGRPIMSAFHALFSGGGFLGSVLGAAAQRAGWDVRLTLGLAAVTCLALTVALVPLLLRDTVATVDAVDVVAVTDATGSQDAATGWSRVPERTRKVMALALIAFVLLLCEGAAADWSALQVREHLDADESTAALAFAAFSFTMTAGRFATDRIAGTFGRVAVVRYGSLICAAGLGLVITSPWVPLTLGGWALCGVGLSGGIPQIFTAAGNLGSSTAATDMSRVFSLGYLGLLAGPAVIGWLTALVPLTTALAAPLVLLLLCSWQAGVVAPPQSERTAATAERPNRG